ncbi:MAG: acetyl-CoA decarbonylase/synthase complex subunit delta [Armatimonadetes bacterium]|nr:acetyl-CoA decarbonylase/synthase complex subunit delta [Armatimonadota bacterium]
MSQSFQVPVERWTARVQEVVIGATPDQGGTRGRTITVGGERTLPFVHFEGETPNPPVIAMEVLDRPRPEWAPALEKAFGDVKHDPVAWAQKCVEEYGADMICLRFEGASPDELDRSPDECAEIARKVADAVKVPLIIWGSGSPDKDNNIWPILSQAVAGERCVLASATQDNYRTIAAVALADRHIVLTEAPLDINIQKQVNILVTEMGVKPENIIQYQVTGALGYGIEYAYSIFERTRIAALGGDTMLSPPMLAVVGPEAWKTKEAVAPPQDVPEWGDDPEKRGILWEAATATVFLHGGCDILVMWHPEAVRLVRRVIDGLMQRE